MLYLKPTPPKEYYRFRLLGFKSAKSDRDYPFVVRYLHTVWVEGEDGKRHSENIVCPVTPFVKAKWNGDPMNDCPICRFANANFVAWKQSGWKDKESAKKNREYGRKFEALIPVYVVNDPVRPTNNGHFRVFSFTDKDQYKQFTDLVMKKSREAMVFNGKNALDFYLRFEEVEETLRPGQPNEYVWKHAVLKQMGFTTKPYDIPAITKEAVDAFPFDETYYVASTMSELNEFYNKHVKVSNDDIPDEEEEVNNVISQPKAEVKKTNLIENTEIKPTVKNDEPLSDLPFDEPEEEDANPNPEAMKTEEDEADIDDLLDEEPKQEVATPVKKEAAKLASDPAEDIPEEKATPAEAPKKTNGPEIENIDDLLDGII